MSTNVNWLLLTIPTLVRGIVHFAKLVEIHGF